MMTWSNGNIFRVTGRLCGEFTGPGEFPAQRPVTRSFDVFFDMCLNKRLSKQPWGWWFETLSRPLWRHRNASAIEVTLKNYGNIVWYQTIKLYTQQRANCLHIHDDVIKWKKKSALVAFCARNAPVTGEFPHKGQWRGALMFILICTWINGWVNNREAGDLRHNPAQYDVTVMFSGCITILLSSEKY